MIKKIHVNSHRIRDNKKSGRSSPPIIVHRKGQRHYGHEVEIDGPSTVIYSAENPLYGAAHVWITTSSPVTLKRRLDDGGVESEILD